MAKKVMRTCVTCKTTFMAREADVKRGWARFCSKSCKAREQEQRTGQHAARLSADEDDAHGHIFASGFFGHGQE